MSEAFSHPALDAIRSPQTRAKIALYLDCLQRWSGKINLTGAETRDAVIDTLVIPALGAEDFLSGHVIDVGSGNGSPGLILAAHRPDLTFTLLEPRAKRWAFLREASRDMRLENTEVRRERSEGYTGTRGQTVTIRAVGLRPDELKPLLQPGGCVLVFGGPDLLGAESLKLPQGSRVQRQCFT